MKKILFTVLATLLMFVSCAKIDVVRDIQIPQNDVEIVFNTHAGNDMMTKAIIETRTMPDNSEFGVYAYVRESTTNKYYLIDKGHYKVTSNIAAATGDEKYYWPKSDNNTTYNVDFLAIYPYTATYSRTNNTVNVTLSASTVGTESVDVLYAIANGEHHQEVNKLDNSAPDKYRPDLSFKHALSLIEFKGKHAGSTNNITSVTVTNIEFLDGNNAAYPIITSGTLLFTENTGWIADTTHVTGNTTNNTLNFGNNVNLSDSYTTISKSILVPQLVPNRVRITYDITIGNSTGEAITFTGRQVVKTINTGSDMTDNTPRNYVTNWYSGKHYVYKYYITVEAIEFDVEVEDWTTPNGWQIWDHDVASYVDRFFDKASTMQAQNMVGIMA